jgi:hypothetical protein
MAGAAVLLFIGRRNMTILRIAVCVKAAIVTYSLFSILYPGPTDAGACPKPERSSG